MSEFAVRKWYFAVNEAGLVRYRRLILTAVRSCLANTPLAPHCLYFGAPIDALRTLRKAGVQVIPHVPSLEPELKIGYGENYPTFAGHWLRADLPLVETEDPFVLYTDIDVLFLKWQPELLIRPTYLAVAPEHRVEDTDRFNSGVMVLNLENMRADLGNFHAAIRRRLLNNFKYPNHDQKSFNDHFSGRYDHLSPLMNWKPYWGRNDAASIVHFHGPKPNNVAAIRDGRYSGKPSFVTIWQRNPDGYDYYAELWRSYSKPAEPARKRA
jgi:hypothetical protein